MTLGKCWTTWELMFAGCFYPNRAQPYIPENLKKMVGFIAFITDALQHLRSQMAPKFAPPLTWHTIRMNVVKPIIEVLNSTDIEVYCYCLDALGDVRRKEKRETDYKRYDTKKEKPVVIPFENGKYTDPDRPLPLPMNEFFTDMKARVALYADLLEFFKSDEVRASIPEGKCIVFSGAVEVIEEDYDNWRRVSPLRITRQGVHSIDELDPDAVCEGDLQVFQLALWVVRTYPKKGDIMIYSKDGDVPMYALLMMRVFVRVAPGIRIYCKTERAAVSDTRKRSADEELESSSSKKQVAASSSSSTPKPRRRPDFQDRYIDICTMLQRMSEEADRFNKRLSNYISQQKGLNKREKTALIKESKIFAAAEEWVAATIFSSSSHDYLDTQDFRYGAVDTFAMRAYPWWRHYFTPLVKISRRNRPDEQYLPLSTPNHHVYYVNIANVDRYIDFCYYEKVFDTLQKKGDITSADHDADPGEILHEFDLEIMEKAQKLRKTNEKTALTKLHKRLKERHEASKSSTPLRLPTQRERLVAGCARLAWVLHYGGVGGIQESSVVDGLKVDQVSGLSIHGFGERGFEWIVAYRDDEWRKCG